MLNNLMDMRWEMVIDLMDVLRREMVIDLMEVRGEWDGVRDEWPESGSTGGKSPPETAKEKTVIVIWDEPCPPYKAEFWD